jgi:glutathione S-transferase
MRLRYSPTSPYARKVLAAAIEMGVEKMIEVEAVNPWDPDSDVATANPLGKVPALLLDDGMVLYDSPVICEYLDSLHQGPKMLPAEAPRRWQVLRLQALGDGMMDAALLIFLEHKRREAAVRSEWWLQLQGATLRRSVADLDRQSLAFPGQPDIGQIAVACTLGYMDFRIADLDWRNLAPRLAEWYQVFSRRPAMQATEPVDPL